MMRTSFILVLILCMPGCLFHVPAATRHERAQQLYDELYYQYQNERSILHTGNNPTIIQKQLKDEILVAHDYYLRAECPWYVRMARGPKAYRCYPLIRYKKQLDQNIKRAQKKYADCWMDDELLLGYQQLFDDLEHISRSLVTMHSYQDECKRYEKQKKQAEQQQELAFLLDKQNRYIKEQNTLIKEQQGQHHDSDDDRVPPAHVIHT